jgi:hypothetical protein
VIWFTISLSFVIATSLDMINRPVDDTLEPEYEEYDKGHKERECLYKWVID